MKELSAISLACGHVGVASSCWLVDVAGPTIGGAIPGRMGPGCIKKVAGCEPQSEPVISAPPPSVLQFLPWLSSTLGCNVDAI